MIQLRLTRTVKWLLIANVALFIIQQTVDRFMGGNLLGWLGLVPGAFVMQFRVWQLFTYPFLHGDVMHLFFNMLMLVFIGSEIEAVWGRNRFLRFYFLCSSVAGLAYLFMQFFVTGGLQVPMVGASGAIYGLLMAYGLLFGERVLLFMLLFPMKAKHFIWILAGVEFLTSLYSPGGGLSSVAHLGGMLTGFLYVWGRAYWNARRRMRGMMDRKPFLRTGRRKKKRDSTHLRLVVNREDEDDDGPKTWH